jgi:hypothetical protein
MATPQRFTAVGVFSRRDDVMAAIAALQAAGFRPEEIGTASRDKQTTANPRPRPESGNRLEQGVTAGAAAGGALGALASALVTGLIPGIGPILATGSVLTALVGGTTLGVAAGGVIGALIGAGITEDEAAYYEREFSSGSIVVAVQAGARAAEAADILRRHGAYRATAARTSSASPAMPPTAAASPAEATGGAAATEPRNPRPGSRP